MVPSLGSSIFMIVMTEGLFHFLGKVPPMMYVFNNFGNGQNNIELLLAYRFSYILLNQMICGIGVFEIKLYTSAS